MEEAGIVSVLLVAAFKFLFAGLVAYGLGYGFLKTFIITAIGGSLGMAVFYWAGTRVLEWFRLRHLRRMERRRAKGSPAPRVFTRTNRWIVHVKHAYGMPALTIMPPILSIPLTALLAAKYFRHERRTLPMLLFAVVAWSAILSTVWGLLR